MRHAAGDEIRENVRPLDDPFCLMLAARETGAKMS